MAVGQRRETRPRAAVRAEYAVVDRHALAHPDQSVTIVSSMWATHASVDDLDDELVRSVVDLDVGGADAGVLDHVRQRFLDDSKDRQVDARRQLARGTRNGQLDLQSCRGRPFDEAWDIAQPGSRRKSQRRLRGDRIVRAQHAEQLPHLCECLASDRLDGM